MTFTVHFINDKMKMMARVLSMKNVPGSHTADVLRRRIMDVLEEWNLTNKVIAIVTDNGAKKMAVEDGKWRHISCFVHTLNLVVNNPRVKK